MESYLETGLDERLSARQVLENWKLQAELVTLSACQTGVSRILRSDEPLGLVRAFLSAGARAVLASQWPVEDLPTLLLMQRFYAELERLGDAAAALGAAQGWLRCLTAGEAAARWQDSLAPALPGTANPFLSLPAGERLYERPACWAGFILVEG
jgi:CHAT domain-containing protein